MGILIYFLPLNQFFNLGFVQTQPQIFLNFKQLYFFPTLVCIFGHQRRERGGFKKTVFGLKWTGFLISPPLFFGQGSWESFPLNI